MEPPDVSTQTSSSFPLDPSEFGADDRISFSKLDNKFLLVQDDGTEFEFDEAIKRWIPVLDEALLEEQQKAYAVQGVDENEPVEEQRKKRKKEYVNGEDVRALSPSFSYVYIFATNGLPADKTSGKWKGCQST
jgi:HIV Tat-specific factor 1